MFNKENWLKKTKEQYNGCPLFNGREKGDMDELTGKVVTLKEAYPYKSNDGDYHAFTVEEMPDKVYLSGGALKNLLNEAKESGDVDFLCEHGLQFKPLPMVEVKSQRGRTFRPIEVIGFAR